MKNMPPSRSNNKRHLFALYLHVAAASLLATLPILGETTTDNIDMKAIKNAISAAKQTPTIENLQTARKHLDAYAPKEKESKVEKLRLSAQLLSVVSTKLDTNRRKNIPKPTGNVFPPSHSGVIISGMSPDAIKDPKLRKKYEADIAENARNAEFWNEQRSLERLEGIWTFFLAHDAASLYGKDQEAANKVKRELADQGMAPKHISRVLEEIKAK